MNKTYVTHLRDRLAKQGVMFDTAATQKEKWACLRAVPLTLLMMCVGMGIYLTHKMYKSIYHILLLAAAVKILFFT